MAIAYDAASQGGTGSSPLTFAHTCTGSDRVLVLGAYTNHSAGSNPASATYNGVAMTRVAGQAEPAGHTHDLFVLINPASGANNIVISNSSVNTLQGYAASYTGCDQTTQPDAFTTNTNTGLSITTSLTTIADNSWVVGVMRGGDTLTAGAGATERTTTGDITGVFDSNGPKTPAGAYSMTVSVASSLTNYMEVLSLQPPSAAATGNFFLLF